MVDDPGPGPAGRRASSDHGWSVSNPLAYEERGGASRDESRGAGVESREREPPERAHLL